MHRAAALTGVLVLLLALPMAAGFGLVGGTVTGAGHDGNAGGALISGSVEGAVLMDNHAVGLVSGTVTGWGGEPDLSPPTLTGMKIYSTNTTIQAHTVTDKGASNSISCEYSLDGGTTWTAGSYDSSLGCYASDATDTDEIELLWRATDGALLTGQTSEPARSCTVLTVTENDDDEVVHRTESITYTITVSNCLGTDYDLAAVAIDAGMTEPDNDVETLTFNSAGTTGVYTKAYTMGLAAQLGTYTFAASLNDTTNRDLYTSGTPHEITNCLVLDEICSLTSDCCSGHECSQNSCGAADVGGGGGGGGGGGTTTIILDSDGVPALEIPTADLSWGIMVFYLPEEFSKIIHVKNVGDESVDVKAFMQSEALKDATIIDPDDFTIKPGETKEVLVTIGLSSNLNDTFQVVKQDPYMGLQVLQITGASQADVLAGIDTAITLVDEETRVYEVKVKLRPASLLDIVQEISEATGISSMAVFTGIVLVAFGGFWMLLYLIMMGVGV